MHRPRIIGNDQVSSLDMRAQGRKGEYTGQRVHRPPVALLHMAEYTLDQFLLIFGTSEENCSSELFNQQVNNFDIHFPWISARRHATSWMHRNQSRATACRAIPRRATARVVPTFHAVVRFVDVIASQQIIDMGSSISGHVQNEIKVFGGETNGSHQVESPLDLVHHAFKDLQSTTPRLVVLMQLLTFGYASLWQLKGNASLVASDRRMLVAGGQQGTRAVNGRGYTQRNICQGTEIGSWQWSLTKRSENDGSIEAPLTNSGNHLLLALAILRQFMPGIHPGSLIDNNIIEIGIEARNLRPYRTGQEGQCSGREGCFNSMQRGSRYQHIT